MAALNLPAAVYTDAVLATGAQGTRVKREHVAELRAGASRVSGGAAGGATTAAVVVEVDGWRELSFDQTTNRVNSAGWEYDTAGNQTRALSPFGAWQRYEYDAANRLVRVKADDNQTVWASYTYGASNERLISDEGGARTYYAAEGGQVFAEYVEYGTQTTPQWTKSYVYLGGRLLSTFTPTTNGESVQHHHPDRLGTRLVTDPTNGTSFEQASLPFGNGLPSETSGATNRRFTSYDRSNATGLDYAVNRRYDSLQGRFTQVDPIEMAAVDLSDPQTLNLYAYCGNDPVNHTDPDGLFFGKLFKWIGKALKILTIAAAVIGVAILFAPASSFVFKAALWLMFNVLIPLSQIPILGPALGVAGIGSFATPGWNPDAKGFGFGNSFQDGPRVYRDGQIATCTTGSDCTSVIALPNETVSVIARSSVFRKIWRAVNIGLDKGVTFAEGFADTITWGAGSWGRRKLAGALGGQAAVDYQVRDDAIRQESWFYTGGQVAGVAWDIAVTAGTSEAVESSRFSEKVFRWSWKGQWKNKGVWQRGPHFHLGPGNRLTPYHLPHQADLWLKQLRRNIRSRRWNR